MVLHGSDRPDRIGHRAPRCLLGHRLVMSSANPHSRSPHVIHVRAAEVSTSRGSHAQQLREQIHIYQAIHHATERWPEVSELSYRSTSPDELLAQLAVLFDIDEEQSRAILDLQIRRVTVSERQKTAETLAALRRDLAELPEA